MMSTQWVQRLTQVEQRVIPRQVVVPDAVQLMQMAGRSPIRGNGRCSNRPRRAFS